MTEPLSKIIENTVGSMSCEIALNSILIREDNARITKIVMSRYMEYKEGIKLVMQSNLNKDFTKKMLLLWKQDQIARVEKRENKLPRDAYTHLQCCMVAQYRQALKSLKEADND